MASIYEKAAKGEMTALEAVYEKCSGKIWLIAGLLTGSSEDTQAAAPAVLEGLLKKITAGSVKSDDDLQNAILTGCAETCRSIAARKNPKAFSPGAFKESAESLDSASSIYSGDASKGAEALAQALKGLAPIQRFALILKACGMSFEDIAKNIKQSEGLTRGVYGATLPQLKTALEGLAAKGYSIDIPKPEQLADMMPAALSAAKVPESADKSCRVLLNTFEQKPAMSKKFKIILAAALAGVVAILLGIGLAAGKKPADNSGENAAPAIDPGEKLSAVIDIENEGVITVELDAQSAPITVANFVELAESGFYDGLTFHRIMKDFMMQGGAPGGDSSAGSGKNIKGEFYANGVNNLRSHVRGTISMARAKDYDSASSQFFIVHQDSTFLDGDYAAFGMVTSGIEVVDKICNEAKPTDINGTIPADQQPVIKSITIVRE